ncbi:MAG TPA: KUP/HAK/KT family potassium transporter, partial [Gaiellales bacterium]|nr:KUP/HAK/KT family potassium transporter [Gaiellales bacterium]
LVFTLHPLAPTPTHVYGVVSLIFWSLVMVVTLKYLLLILRADNHGEGGIMALVALIERCVQGRRRTALIVVGILGASLFYGDGMLTPAVSVVSAPGLQVASPAWPRRSSRSRSRSWWRCSPCSGSAPGRSGCCSDRSC